MSALMTLTDPARGRTSLRAVPDSIPFSRIVRVELRKMFDTRAGLWLMASIVVLSLLASAAVLVFGGDGDIALSQFMTATGFPLAVVLPVIAILAVTSEYSQRTGLSTYTLEPRRARVVLAKLGLSVAVGAVAMVVALASGSLATVVGGALRGVDPSWDVTVVQFAGITLGSILWLVMGFTLGALFRNSPAAVVGYFVYNLVLPGLLGLLAAYQGWFRDLQPWVDATFTTNRLFEDGLPTGEALAQLGSSTLLWMWVPLVVGIRLLLRSEVK